jgi:hypothetical protein
VKEEPIQLGEVAAALAASFVIKDERVHLPREALEQARRAVLSEPTEEVLLDLASLRAKVERVVGQQGAEICEMLDEVLADGLRSRETTSGWRR